MVLRVRDSYVDYRPLIRKALGADPHGERLTPESMNVRVFLNNTLYSSQKRPSDLTNDQLDEIRYITERT